MAKSPWSNSKRIWLQMTSYTKKKYLSGSSTKLQTPNLQFFDQNFWDHPSPNPDSLAQWPSSPIGNMPGECASRTSDQLLRRWRLTAAVAFLQPKLPSASVSSLVIAPKRSFGWGANHQISLESAPAQRAPGELAKTMAFSLQTKILSFVKSLFQHQNAPKMLVSLLFLKKKTEHAWEKITRKGHRNPSKIHLREEKKMLENQMFSHLITLSTL